MMVPQIPIIAFIGLMILMMMFMMGRRTFKDLFCSMRRRSSLEHTLHYESSSSKAAENVNSELEDHSPGSEAKYGVQGSMLGPETLPSPVFCLSCGEVLSKEDRYCPSCGEARPICMISKMPILPNDLAVRCPHCKNLAHRHHMLEWLKVKGTCPVCRTKLKEIDIISL